MFNITIDVREAFDALLAIVKRFGPDHYAVSPDGEAGCIYAVVENGVLRPVCIVGQWFAQMGLLGLLVEQPTMDALSTSNGYLGLGSFDRPEQFGACTHNSEVWNRLALVGIEVTPEAREFVRLVQAEQDSGHTWADSLRQAAQETHRKAAAALPTAGLAERVPAPLSDWEKELLHGNPWDSPSDTEPPF